MPLRFDLVRQSREQATVSKTHASMSVGGHALPPHPLILKWLMAPLPPVFQRSRVSSIVCGMKSENPRSVLLSSVFYGHILFFDNLSFGFLSLLCYIVGVYSLM